MAGCIFAVVVSFVLPIGACIFFTVRQKSAKPVLLGAACFTVFQVLTRLPALQYLLPMSAQYEMLQMSHPIVFSLFLAVTAGIFEECGRYLIMKCFMKNAPLSRGIAFGLGHGATEAMLLVGINTLWLLFSGMYISSAPMDFFLSGVERIFAISAHICWSAMVLRAIREKKPPLLFVAILSHAVFDFVATFLSYSGASDILIEAVCAVIAAILAVYTAVIYKKISTEGEPL